MDYYTLVLKLGRIYGRIPQYIHPAGGWAFPPLFLVLEPTYHCNLECPYCYVDRAADRHNGSELTAAEIEHIIGQTPLWTLIMLSGGEVLLRRDSDQIIRQIARKRRTQIFTNGTLLTAATAQQWVDFGVASVAISVDGPEHIHDAMRGSGTFSRAVSAIKMIVATKEQKGKAFPLINLKATVTAENVSYLTEIIRLAEAMGVDYCTFQMLNRTMRFGGSKLQDSIEYNLPPPDIPDFPLSALEDELQAIRATPHKRVRVRILPDLPVPAILDHYANRLDPRKFKCISPWTVLYVSPYGDVYPCLDYWVGNVRNQSLQKLWNCSRYRLFRRSLMRRRLFPDCSGCCDLFLPGGFLRKQPAEGEDNKSKCEILHF